MSTEIVKRQPKKNRFPIWKIVLVTAIALTVLLIIGLGGFLKLYRPSVDTDVPPFGVDDPPTVNTGDDTSPSDEDKYIRDTESVNFLLAGRDKDAWNTDVMMLVNFNMREGSVSVLQIPRDTYIDLDNMRGRVNTLMKLNRQAAYREDPSLSSDELIKAGMRGTVEMLEKSLCVQIDGYAIVNLEGFRNIVQR